jgi:hypothetical protein
MNRNMQRLRRRGVRCACRKREASFAERSFRRTAAEGSFRVGVPKSVGGSFRNSVTACVSVPGSSPLKDFEVYERSLLRKSQRAFIYEARWYRDDDRPLHDTCRGRFFVWQRAKDAPSCLHEMVQVWRVRYIERRSLEMYKGNSKVFPGTQRGDDNDPEI